MEKENHGFRMSKDRSTPFDEYIKSGSYVVIHQRNQESFAGVIKDEKEDWLYILPYTVMKYDSGVQKYQIIEDGLPSLMRKEEIVRIVPTTRKDIEYFGKINDWRNRKGVEEERLKEIEVHSKLSPSGIVIVPG